MKTRKYLQSGFTLTELLIVIVIIGILATLIYNQYTDTKKRSYHVSALNEMKSIIKATEYYNFYYGDYPADVTRDIPSDLEQFVSNVNGESWPNAPYPNSVYDYDRFTYDGVDTIQISIRFCPVGGTLVDCDFPEEPWAANFGVNSSIYVCLKGNCKAHPNMPPSYEGYCAFGCSADRTAGPYYQPAGFPI